MKFHIFLIGLLLVFLLVFQTTVTESDDNTVDIRTLSHIINTVEERYKRVDEDGHPRQYAVAINVSKDQCQQNFNRNTFLTQENAENVKNAITDETNALYQGEELIAAGTRKVVISKKKQYNKHSESLLMNPADNSPMNRLMNKRKDGCTIFFTLKSPCVDTCLNATGKYSIKPALKKWEEEHDGIKAFVFKDFWKFDTEKDLETEFKQIAAHVPLFRYVGNECYPCNGEGDTPINPRCLPPKNVSRLSFL